MVHCFSFFLQCHISLSLKSSPLPPFFSLLLKDISCALPEFWWWHILWQLFGNSLWMTANLKRDIQSTFNLRLYCWSYLIFFKWKMLKIRYLRIKLSSFREARGCIPCRSQAPGQIPHRLHVTGATKALPDLHWVQLPCCANSQSPPLLLHEPPAVTTVQVIYPPLHPQTPCLLPFLLVSSLCCHLVGNPSPPLLSHGWASLLPLPDAWFPTPHPLLLPQAA